MKYKYFILLIILAVLFSESEGYAGASHRYGSNARGIALSNSLVSSYNKGYNPLTNPALLGRESAQLEYGFSYFSMSLDRSVQTFSISIPAPPYASIGLSLFMISIDDIQGTDDNGNYTDLYKSWEGFGMLSFGVELGKISTGVNIKMMKNKIDAYGGDGLGLDIGFLYKNSPRHQFGFFIENLYAKYTWDIASLYEEKFPQILLFGGSSKINNNILYLYQIDYSSESERLVCKLGVELDMFSMKNIPMDIRLGINNKNNSFNPSLGFGYSISMKNKLNLGIDYAIDPGMVDEGVSHLFTLTFHKS